jgi:hypothetical protein
MRWLPEHVTRVVLDAVPLEESRELLLKAQSSMVLVLSSLGALTLNAA